MVLIEINNYFPAQNSAKIGKQYLEVMKKYPADNTLYKQVIPVAVRGTTDGINGKAIYEIKPGKVKETLELVYKRQLMLAEVEGYRYEVNIYLSGAEAMPLVGLAMPV